MLAPRDEIELRPARAGEEQELLAAYQWLFEPPARIPPSWDRDRALAALREAIESDGAAVFVAEEGREIVGVCAAYLDIHSVRFGPRCWVEDLAVHPGHRSQGIGERLLTTASEWARERGATHIELDTSESRDRAQRFYERRGKSHRGISYSWEL